MAFIRAGRLVAGVDAIGMKICKLVLGSLLLLPGIEGTASALPLRTLSKMAHF